MGLPIFSAVVFVNTLYPPPPKRTSTEARPSSPTPERALVMDEPRNTISFLSNIIENDTYKIILSVMESSKTVYQIHEETSLPLSSIYKRIKKLEDIGIISIEKITINNKGRKLIFYKSKIKNLTFKLNEKDASLLIT